MTGEVNHAPLAQRAKTLAAVGKKLVSFTAAIPVMIAIS
jgi:hypothetical protein